MKNIVLAILLIFSMPQKAAWYHVPKHHDLQERGPEKPNSYTLTVNNCKKYFSGGKLSASQQSKCLADPSTVVSKVEGHNLRTNAGSDMYSACLFGTAACTTITYLALSSDTAAPAVTDTSCASEIVSTGMTRAQLTMSHTSGNNYTVGTHTWTNSSGGTVTVNKLCTFVGSSGGTLMNEAMLSYGNSVANSSTITLNYTWNY